MLNAKQYAYYLSISVPIFIYNLRILQNANHEESTPNNRVLHIFQFYHLLHVLNISVHNYYDFS